MIPANLQSVWARLFVGHLVKNGVKEAVISPGSRSTPWVLAAQAQANLRCHLVVDERSAAFFALGIAKTTGRAPLLICTSGSAPAHYLPAIIESRHSSIPLLVLTADRPSELQQCGASQTVDQVKMFGDFTRGFLDLGDPSDSDGAWAWLTERAAWAAHQANGVPGGTVHINARARKPLETPSALTREESALEERVAELAQRRPVAVYAAAMAPAPDGVDTVAESCRSARRGLIVCGPCDLSVASARPALAEISRRTRFPVLCEAASQLRFGHSPAQVDVIDASDTLLRSKSFSREHEPDLILQIGAFPTSSAWERYLQLHTHVPRWVLGKPWLDPPNSASGVLEGPVADLVAALSHRLSELGWYAEPTSWAAEWLDANARVWDIVDRAIAQQLPLSEACAVRLAVESVPRDSLLVLGNSLPIREVDTFCRADLASCDVLTQRGAAGIDGLISGAAGAAISGRRTTLLIGDVSFEHDLGGLAIAAQVKTPLVVVVLNNGGGRIFEQLPIARVAQPPDLDAWTTPRVTNFEAAASLHSLRFQRADCASALESALAAAHAHPGCTVIEAVVPPHSALELSSAIEAQLDGEGFGSRESA